MPYQIGFVEELMGVLTPKALKKEEEIVKIPNQAEFYLVEGYIDCSALEAHDKITIKEYFATDRVNLRVFAKEEYGLGTAFPTPLETPVIRFPCKQFRFAYKVTLTQDEGTIKSFPYYFLVLKMEFVPR